MDFNDLLNLMIQQKASDLFITANVEPSMKINGQIVPITKTKLTGEIVGQLLNSISVHDKFHRALVLSGFFFLKIASTFLNSSFFPKPIKRRIAIWT